MAKKELEISQVIKPETVDLEVNSSFNKEQLLDYMISMLFNASIVNSQEEYLNSIYQRESMGPTYMGNYIAIPHGKCKAVVKPGIAFCRSKKSIFYPTEQGGGEVKLIFMLAIPEQMSGEEYIRVLAQLARLLVYPDFTDCLYQAKNYSEVITAIKEFEMKLE